MTVRHGDFEIGQNSSPIDSDGLPGNTSIYKLDSDPNGAVD